MNLKKNMGKIGLVVMGATFASQIALAAPVSMERSATGWTSFSTTVGRLNGSAYTSYRTKASTKNAEINKFYNGGYNADVRLNGTNSGSWKRSIGSTTTGTVSISTHSSHKNGSSVRIQVSNNLTTLVNTQATGDWRPN